MHICSRGFNVQCTNVSEGVYYEIEHICVRIELQWNRIFFIQLFVHEYELQF